MGLKNITMATGQQSSMEAAVTALAMMQKYVTGSLLCSCLSHLPALTRQGRIWQM